MASTRPPRGVYKNPRLMHASTFIVGSVVHLQTTSGSIWEGIFTTFSPDYTINLQLAVEIVPKSNRKDNLYAALKAGKKVSQQAFFELKDIVRISVVDFDIKSASVDQTKLATDTDISGYDATKVATSVGGKQLETWQDDDGDNVHVSLDDALPSNSRGWDAKDMFSYNERVHKVTTTYDEKLTNYTVPLPKHNSKEWVKKQERAAMIAKEIEGNTKSQSRLAKEDEGDCEEEKFSAVVRPTPPATRPSPPANRPSPPATRPSPPTNRPSPPAIRQPPPAVRPAPPSDNTIQQHNAVTNVKEIEADAKSQSRLTKEDDGDCDEDKSGVTARPSPSAARPPASSNNMMQQHKNFRPRLDRNRMERIDSLKNFSNKLVIDTPSHQSELARKSKLNPHAKEFVYRPNQAQSQASQVSSAPAIDSNVSSPMTQAYYPQVPVFPHGLSPQQQHHAAQYMPHPYMASPYIRGNFQNYHHRGEHHNNVRAEYPQVSMMVPTTAGQPFVPLPSGAPPHPMNPYATAPQQQMIYNGQSMYPMPPQNWPRFWVPDGGFWS